MNYRSNYFPLFLFYILQYLLIAHYHEKKQYYTLDFLWFFLINKMKELHFLFLHFWYVLNLYQIKKFCPIDKNLPMVAQCFFRNVGILPIGLKILVAPLPTISLYQSFSFFQILLIHFFCFIYIYLIMS